MKELKSIARKRILASKTESVFLLITVILASATLFMCFSLGINYIEFFISEAEALTNSPLHEVVRSGATNMSEIIKYMGVLLIFIKSNAGADEPPPAADNADSVFSAVSTVENLPFTIIFMTVTALLTVYISLSVVFSVCKRERFNFFATLLISGASKKHIKKCAFYEAVYFCLAAIPGGLVLGCLEVYAVKSAAVKAFKELSLTYGGKVFPVDIKISVIAAVVTVPIIFLMVCRFSEKACKKLSIKTVATDIKKTFVTDIGMRTFSADPRSYRNFGIEFYIAFRNFHNNLGKYAKIIFLTVMYVMLMGATFIMFNAVRGYNGEMVLSDEELLAFSYSAEVYFCAVTAAIMIITLMSTFNAISANINSNISEYALMRSAGSSVKSVLRTVRLEGFICNLIGVAFGTLSIISFLAMVDQIYREDARVYIGGNEAALIVVAAVLILFSLFVMSTVLMMSRKMKKINMIAVLKDLLY